MEFTQKPELLVLAFIDYVCPFCHVGAESLERLRCFYTLKVNWCFLEIDPHSSSCGTQAPVKFGEGGYKEEDWNRVMSSLCMIAEKEHVQVEEETFTTNSRRAMLLAEAAKEEGVEKFYALHRRLFSAFNVSKQNIGDVEILCNIAKDAGISEETVTRAWTDPKYEQKLKENRTKAIQLGIRGTPTLVIGGQSYSGAVSTEMLLNAARVSRELLRDFI